MTGGGREPAEVESEVARAPRPRRRSADVLRRRSAAAVTAVTAQLAEERPRFVNWLPVLLGLGIAAYFALPREPSAAAALLPFATGAVALALAPPHGLARVLAGGLIVAAAGFVLAKVRTDVVAAPVLERTLRSVAVTGVVERREPHAKRGERLTLRLVAVGDVAPERMPRRARIRVMAPAGELRPGATVTLTATLSPPAPPALPGGHDFARAAFFEGIGAVGYALKPPVVSPAAEEAGLRLRLSALIEDLRFKIAHRIGAALPGERGALAAALITGERGGVSEATTAAYRDSGLIHILSISGLHMAIMAGSLYALVRVLLAAVPALALTRPIKAWAAAAGVLGALLYLAISGGSAATLRAAIMMIVMFLAIMLGRSAIAMRNVAIAALVILVLAPESLLDVGFQMSFAAVAALVAAYEALRGRMDRTGFAPGPAARGALFLGGILFSTVIAGLAVTPLSVYHFHAMQHYAPLANLVAVPVCNLLVMPAALATLAALPFGLEAAPLAAMGLGLDVMGTIAASVAALPGAVTHVPQVPDPAFALVLVGGLWLVLWQRPWRLVGLPLVLAGLALVPAGTRPDILIGREGALVAVREPGTGALAAHAERPSTFEIRRWLEQDGDAREPAAVRKGAVFRCDALGCATDAPGVLVVVSRHPAGAAEDCARAVILVVHGAAPTACDGPRLVYDRAALKAAGTVALYRTDDGGWLSESVAGERGERPWSAHLRPQKAGPRSDRLPAIRSPGGPEDGIGRTAAPHASSEDGVGRYAAPRAVADAFENTDDILRPEIEDEDAR